MIATQEALDAQLEQEQEQEQEQALEACEVALFGGLRQQLEASALVGAQLVRIRERELYRTTGCDSFELYCRKYLELNRDQVRRYLQLHEVVETIRAANMELPANETQAVMLAKIPRTRLTACWRVVLEVCIREEIALSETVVRRAVRFERASGQQRSPSESIPQKRTEKPRSGGVKVTLEV